MKDSGHPLAPRVDVEFAQIDAIDLDPSSIRIVEAAQQLRERSLAGSILADERLRRAICKGIDRRALVDIVEHGLTGHPVPLDNHVFVAGQVGYENNSAPAAYNLDEAGRDGVIDYSKMSKEDLVNYSAILNREIAQIDRLTELLRYFGKVDDAVLEGAGSQEDVVRKVDEEMQR